MSRVRSSELTAACQTDAGRVRANNEDLFVCDVERGIFAVIDGVGGQAAGEVAAAIARRVMLDRLARPLGTPAERVREAIALANNEIFRASEESPAHRGMTCVLTVAVVDDRRMTLGHVGDSRLYKISPDGIRKLTHDHSPIGEREDAHELSELQAMRHPRRHEVFRDVGGVYRDKDEEPFVEIVEDTIEDDSAILLCTDGLTDLVPSSAIADVVSRHAGDPQAVADALVRAANDAGGTDNVTVLYAEAPGFARAVRASAANRIGDISQRIAVRRTAWLAAGTLTGVLAALLLSWSLGAASPPAARTLQVGGTGSDAGRTFSRIADAVASARAGDTVQLEPGAYDEQVNLPDGVDLIARIPGTATLTRSASAAGEWTAVTAGGSGRIRGIRIVSTSNAPIDVAITVSGGDRRIELIDLDGPMNAAIDVGGAASVTINGCFVHTGRGPALVIDTAADVTLANNTFVHAGGGAQPAVVLKGDVWPILDRNVFGGYGSAIIAGASPDTIAQLLSGNFLVSSPPAAVP
jgi:serine/threonine protein phosphatase PrpC